MDLFYHEPGLDFRYYDQFLTPESAEMLFNLIEEEVEFKSLTRRSKVIFGNEGMVYSVNFRGNIANYSVKSWTEFPILLEIKKHLEDLTQNTYTCCVIQRYPSGKIGINKHRDKEMVHGTTIAGISLGTSGGDPTKRPSRTFVLSRGQREIRVSLNSGSLYLICPPTNDYWTHEIPPSPLEEESGIRISLTYRNY